MKVTRRDTRHASRAPHQSHQERLDQAAKARRAQVERSRHIVEQEAKQQAAVEAKQKQVDRDAGAYRAVLGETAFWRSGDADRYFVDESYLKLVDVAVRCLEAKTREAVLCWPHFEASPAALAALLAHADSAATATIRKDNIDARAPPLGIRALIFPYARSAHRSLRHIYVDKDALGRLHTLHQSRSLIQADRPELADYHKTLARTKTLSGMALDGKRYDEFRHPCLDETLPSGPCSGNDGRSELLWRIRTKTDLSKISRTGQADHPDSAKFYLFGLRSADAMVPSLKALRKRLDIVFLDLCHTGRNRLGRNWLERVQKFLAELDRHVGSVATVALADDPWTLDRLRFDALPRAPVIKGRRPKPEASSIIFGHRSDIVVTSQPSPPDYSDLLKQDAIGFSGDVETLLRRIRADAREAAALRDQSTAELLFRLSGIIRRCASLPGSRDDLSRYVEAEVGGMAAADLLASYRVGAAIAELKGALGPWSQHRNAELTDLCATIDRIWNNTSQLTPMAPLLKDAVKRFLRTSSRTALLFRNDMLADFAANALRHDEECGTVIDSRIEKRMLLFLDNNRFEDLLQLPETERNYIKTLVCVAPTRAQILALLSRPWLPDNLVVLADSDTLANAGRDATRLASFPELNAIHSRLMEFGKKAAQTVHHAGLGEGVEEARDEDVEFPTSGVVNLAGVVRPDQPVIHLTMSSGQVVIARPGTKLILFDRARTVPVFTECEAKDVEEDDRVCVIGDAFLEMARPLLNITARAAEEIRDYHQLVLDRFSRISGSSVSERLGRVVAAMGLPTVTVQRAQYWIDLQDQLQAPLHEVVPHAPQDAPTFLAFMKALDVSESIAARFWTWAVIAQRTSRLRAAISFHDAYRAILIDTYAAQASNPARARDVRRLRTAAEEFVAVVREKKEERGDRERA